MRIAAPGALLCLSILAFTPGLANAARPAQSLPSAVPAQNIPLIDEPLRLADFLPMQPIPELKDKLVHIAGFIQATPQDGKPATQSTEVWAAHTRTALYIVFICHDDKTSQIRGHLARRENIMSDDYVSVLLDPFHDHRRGIYFAVNPAGVQADASWSESNGPDFSYDLVWDSEARVTASGWVALLSIPFRSLRFPRGAAHWGVVFGRSLPRNSETDFWPRVAADVSGILSQEATLTGIEGVTGSHNLQLNPYTIGQNEHTLNSIDPLNPFFSSRAFEATAGGELKAILKDSIVLDATLNPDFSDVESDQPQFTVNQRYPVYFPELRPFFLENANYFATPIQLVFTRNIVHPEYGVRVTGKAGRTNLGLFAIDDRQPGETVTLGDPLYKKRALFSVGRLSRDLGKSSSAGLIYTDEEFGQGFNRIGGADFTWRADDHWTVFGQSVVSSTKGTAESGNPPSYAAGPATYLEVQRSGHAFNFDSTNKDFSSNFQSQVGFIPTTNIRTDQTHATYQWFPKKSRILQSWGVETNQNIAFDHQGNRIFHNSEFDPFLLLARNMVIAPVFGSSSDTLGPQNGYLFPKNHNFTENFGGLVVKGAPLTQLNLNLQAIRSGSVNYNPVAGKLPFLMNAQSIQLLFTLQPIRQLTADQTYLLDRDRSIADGALVYENQVFRTKINYQFTRALSARVIAEYDSTLANPLETSIPRTKRIQTQALFTWLPHPGTAIYVGYNNDIQNLDRSLCNRLLTGSCDPNNTDPPRSANYLNDGRQFFIKASYLLRF